MTFSEERTIYQTYSPNYRLIMDNGYGSLVKNLVDIDNEWDSATRIVAEIVGATESNCPGIDKFMEGMPECDLYHLDEDGYKVYEGEHWDDSFKNCICTCYEKTEEYDVIEVECSNYKYHKHAASIQPRLAEMLKEKLPNITSFFLLKDWIPYPYVNIYENILDEYDLQITELVYEGPELDIQLKSPNLRALSYDYSTEYEMYGPFKVSHPESIRKIIGDSWKRVCEDVLDNYDGIEVVRMFDDFKKYVSSLLDDARKQFPNIKFVVFEDVSFAFDGCSWRNV